MTITDIQALDAKAAGSDSFGLTNYDKLKSNVDLLLDIMRGWFSISGACTYSSVDGHTYVMTIVGDYTGLLGIDDKVKVTQSAVIRYFKISLTPTFGAGVTTVTMYGGTDQVLANSAITSPSFSHSKTPFGVNPNPAKWTEELHDTSTRTQSAPTGNVFYNPGSLSLAIPPGPFSVEAEGVLSVSAGTSVATVVARVTLSTANNSESDKDFSAMLRETEASASLISYASFYMRKDLLLTAKTSYYLNIESDNTLASGGIDLQGVERPTIVRAVFAA